MPPAIKAIIFDAYGTLFDVYSIGALGERFFPGAGARLAEMWRDRQIDYTRLRTLGKRYVDFWTITADALDYSCARLGLDLTDTRRAALLGQYAKLQAFPENLAVLDTLRARGLPLAILSNGTPAMLDSAIRAARMQDCFTHVLSVEAVRRFKTAPEAYQMGPDAFGLPASEILFVSSNNWDAVGATWFGHPAFWVNRAGHPGERLGVALAGEGRTLADLPDFVSRFSGAVPAP